MKLLCVTGDEKLSEQLTHEAKRLNLELQIVSPETSLLNVARQSSPDIVILDAQRAEDIQRWEIDRLPEVKAILMITDELTEDMMVDALNRGVDGFLPRPLLSGRHFEARIQAIVRRHKKQHHYPEYQLVIDDQNGCIELRGRKVHLTQTELKLLRELANAAGQTVPRGDIQLSLFGQARERKRSLDVHVCSVRKKIREYGLDIDSVRGVGYRLNPFAS